MTLTQAANFTKRFLLFFIVIIIISFSSWLGYRYYYYNIYLPSLPPPKPKADLKFGKLPNLKFIESSTSATNYKYTLDTVTGDLPDKLPKVMKVFFIPQTSITLLDPNRSSSLAKSLFFVNGPQIISPTQFQFKDGSTGAMTIDLNTGNFYFKRLLEFDPTTASPGTLPQASKIEEDFRKFLNEKGLTKPKLGSGRVKVLYNKSLLKDSTTATISIWPNDVDKYPVETPLFDTSLITQIVKEGEKPEDRVLSMKYTYYGVDEKTSATYPIKSPSNSFKDLKSGHDTVLVKSPNGGDVSIRNIYLAYFESETYSAYLQPIYVYEGQDFAAYVSAIPDDYIEK